MLGKSPTSGFTFIKPAASKTFKALPSFEGSFGIATLSPFLSSLTLEIFLE